LTTQVEPHWGGSGGGGGIGCLCCRDNQFSYSHILQLASKWDAAELHFPAALARALALPCSGPKTSVPQTPGGGERKAGRCVRVGDQETRGGCLQRVSGILFVLPTRPSSLGSFRHLVRPHHRRALDPGGGIKQRTSGPFVLVGMDHSALVLQFRRGLRAVILVSASAVVNGRQRSTRGGLRLSEPNPSPYSSLRCPPFCLQSRFLTCTCCFPS
jgi:hypothetical protein